ncbi:DNA (cytosine-5-)-methyltransferase [Bacillus subtilis]|uniref:DNA cytosine methyltransferase n=1 Tax=Bacillus subtilis group TaxID=653685 RepID=UPI0031F4F051
MNVLSLFDGMSCGQIALEKAGLNINKYFASEIDKNAIEITLKNYPNTIQLGDVKSIDLSSLPQIDLLIGGSPCQGFSIAGKKLNFKDKRSELFFDFVRIKNILKPKYFLFENVKMSNLIADAIDEELGVKRILIDSRHFTGHIRKRYYWTNIPIEDLPDKEYKIKDIIDRSMEFDKNIDFFLNRTVYKPTMSRDGIITINPRDKRGKQTWQRGRVYDISGNCPTICASLFDLNITEDHKNYRKLSINECERLQGVPINYTQGVSKTERGKMLGNGWTVDVISHIFSGINLNEEKEVPIPSLINKYDNTVDQILV